MRPSILFHLSLFAVLSLVSCDRPAKDQPEPTAEATPPIDSSATSPEETRPSGPDLSAEAVVLAGDFEKAALEGDGAFFHELVDLEEVVTRSFEGVQIPAGFMKGVRSGFEESQDRMVSDFTSARYDFIKVVEGGPEPVLRFRVRRDGGLDYADYQFAKNASGDWMLVDALVYSVGTQLSELLRDMLLPAIAEIDRSLIDRLFKGNEAGLHLESLPEIRDGMLLARSGDPESAQKAVEIYKSLPEEMRETRVSMLVYLMAASNLADAFEPGSEYQKALNLFEKVFPNDLSVLLQAIDRTVLAGEFEKCYEVLDKLKALTEDEYIDFFRGYIHLHEEKYSEAERRARVWIKKFPDDAEGWELLLESGFGSNRHAVTAEALERLETEFEMDFSGVSDAEGWEAFNGSPEGKEWWNNR